MPRSPAKNESFKKVYDSMTAFSNNTYQWFQVAELGYDSFMVRALARLICAARTKTAPETGSGAVSVYAVNSSVCRN